MPVVQRQCPGRDSADNCGVPQLQFSWVVWFLDSVVYMAAVVLSSTRWSMSLLCCAMEFRRCSSSTVMTSLWSCRDAKFQHPGRSLGSACAASAQPSSWRIAPIKWLSAATREVKRCPPMVRSSSGSCRSHRALESSSLPSCFDPIVILPRLATPALRLGVIGSLRPFVFYVFLQRYGRRSGQPSSSSLARRACVHVLPFSSPGSAVYGYKFSSSSSTGSSQAPLASPEAEERWQWRSLRPLALPSFVVRFGPLRCTSNAGSPLFPV